MDVSALSCRAKFEPVYFPLHKAIRFFHHLIDTLPSASLAGSFLLPWRTIRHCHVLHKYFNEWLRYLLYSGTAVSTYDPRYKSHTESAYLLVTAYQCLWLLTC